MKTRRLTTLTNHFPEMDISILCDFNTWARQNNIDPLRELNSIKFWLSIDDEFFMESIVGFKVYVIYSNDTEETKINIKNQIILDFFSRS